MSLSLCHLPRYFKTSPSPSPPQAKTVQATKKASQTAKKLYEDIAIAQPQIPENILILQHRVRSPQAPMKYLYITRHAKAKDAELAQADFDRKLSERGKSDAIQAAQWLHSQGTKIDLIVSSPARRTLKTAGIIAQAYQYPEEAIVCEVSIYEATPNILLGIVNDLPDTAEAVMLVGHNPGLTLLADYLSDTEIDFMPTMGIVCLAFETDTWAMVSRGLGRVQWQYREG